MSILNDIYNKILRNNYNQIPVTNGVSYVPQSAISVTARPQSSYSAYNPIVTNTYKPQVLGNKAPAPVVSSGINSPIVQPAQPAQTNNTEVSQPQVDYNSIFEPGFQALTDQENYLRNTDMPEAEASIEKNRLKLAGELGQYQTEAEQATATDKSNLIDSRESALQSARNAYKSLRQQGNARFGGINSAGEAVSELAQQEYLRQQGGVEKSYADGLSDVMGKAQNLYMFITKKKTEIDDQAQEMLKQAKNELSSRLLAINTQRYQLESDKRAQKASALQGAIDFSKQVNLMKIQAQIQLDTFSKEKELEIKNNWQEINSQIIDTSQNIFPDVPNTEISSSTSTAPGVKRSISYGYGLNPDEEELINPFA